MIKKTNPVMFRINKAHKSRAKSHWFAEKGLFSKELIKDYKIRSFIKEHPACHALDDVIIRRNGEKVQVVIKAAQIGGIIGKQGDEIENIRAKLKRIVGQDNVRVEVEEVKNPNLSANIVANNIAKQIEKRARAVTVMREADKLVRKAGALGFKVIVSGRHSGADIARIEKRKSGCIPIQTIRQNIKYAAASANTTYGVMGVKVWITLGDYAFSDKLENLSFSSDAKRGSSRFQQKRNAFGKGTFKKKHSVSREEQSVEQ